jgi:hypothetical protein
MTITIIPYDGLNQVLTSIARNPPVSACAGPQAPAAAAAFGRVPPARPAGRGRCLAACSSVGPPNAHPLRRSHGQQRQVCPVRAYSERGGAAGLSPRPAA